MQKRYHFKQRTWNTEALYLTDALIDTCTSNYVKANAASFFELDIPKDPPVFINNGTLYFDKAAKKLDISDGTIKQIAGQVVPYNWYRVTLTLVPLINLYFLLFGSLCFKCRHNNKNSLLFQKMWNFQNQSILVLILLYLLLPNSDTVNSIRIEIYVINSIETF